MEDRLIRSIAKAATWRIVATGTVFIIAYIVTGELKQATTVALIAMAIKMVLYLIHERLWNRVMWGKKNKMGP